MTKNQSSSPPFSFSEFNDLVLGTEMLYSVGRKLSDGIAKQPCDYLIQEASMVFVKTMMSLLGFLRFIPSSRFLANAREVVIDLSSASVMGRQVLEDILSFFYLSEANLTADEKAFRELVWRFHGLTEHVESTRLAGVAISDAAPRVKEREQLRQRVESHPIFATMQKGRWKDDIRKGYEGHVRHVDDVLKRRGIVSGHFKLPHKILSKQIGRKAGDPFCVQRTPVGMFTAEVLEAFLETFPSTRQLLVEHEPTHIANWRKPLREPI